MGAAYKIVAAFSFCNEVLPAYFGQAKSTQDPDQKLYTSETIAINRACLPIPACSSTHWIPQKSSGLEC